MRSISQQITERVQKAGKQFFANDNIAEFVLPNELAMLQDEVTGKVRELLRALVIDVDNDHNTIRTAQRVAKMYLREVFKGRYIDAPPMADFPNAKECDEMYTTGPITIRSACSHHFVPIIGKCWIGVIPGKRLMGLSKFNRFVDWVASRPQIQEEMIMQIADTIETILEPKGLAVIIKASHMCMTWRGVKEPMSSVMTNSVMRGIFRDNPAAKEEFMRLIEK